MSNDKFKLNIIILNTYYIYTWQSKIVTPTNDILLLIFHFLIYTIKY